MNTVNITGYLGKTPELRKTNTGKSVTSLSVGVRDGYGYNEKTYWIDVVLWEKKAEYAANYLTKGSRVAVMGKLTKRSWEDNTGKKQYAVEVLGLELENISKEQNQSNQQTYTPSENEPTYDDEPTLDITSDDLPF